MVDSVFRLTSHPPVCKAHLHPELLTHLVLFQDPTPLALLLVHSELKQLPPELELEWFS